jgi:hypothetical protein
MYSGTQPLFSPLIYGDGVATMYTAFGDNRITLSGIMLNAQPVLRSTGAYVRHRANILRTIVGMPNALGCSLAFRRHSREEIHGMGGVCGCKLRGWLEAHSDHGLVWPMYLGIEVEQQWNTADTRRT